MSMAELFVVFLVALLVFGPEQLPGLARSLGRLIGKWHDLSDRVKAEIRGQAQLEQLKHNTEKAEKADKQYPTS